MDFFSDPILNSPYKIPTRHHALDESGQPLNEAPRKGRRKASLITPIPKSRKQRWRSSQQDLDLNDAVVGGENDPGYDPISIINEMRSAVDAWRNLKNPRDWSVTASTARLLEHWRHHDFENIRPFFCQLEAVETLIWLTEVAPRMGKRGKDLWNYIERANGDANPELMRIAMKMATGTGKTTVMAMIIAWQTINAVRSPNSKMFSRGFLIVTPGITIRDRLRVLLPNDPDNYYETRELIPNDLVGDIDRAQIIVTNYHSFKLRERMNVVKVSKALLEGREGAIETLETEGQMVQRIAPDLRGQKNIVVINDEAHHCYREKPDIDALEDLDSEEKKAVEQDKEAARLWINGIEALKRKLGVRAVYDLSATPFFLRGSGYVEGTLFPWTVSDFSLMDAIESGIVKLPRVPVADNVPGRDEPIYRKLWEHIKDKMPKKGRGKNATPPDPLSLPSELQTALHALYGHYEKTFAEWEKAGIGVPPVFIVVCNNTTTSKLLYDFISGFRRETEDGEEGHFHDGRLELFRNFDSNGEALSKRRTLLIDSAAIDSGEGLPSDFRDAAADEIEQFKKEKALREGAASVGDVTDEELLREVMNTVGRKGLLGESIRCVVSVSMLTEGWDTNTVTHILGVRAFGTQLLCEQVVGRGLRRQSYELNDRGLFDVEYADVMGIDFDFAGKPVVAKIKPPKETVRVHAVKEREHLEITFPRVEAYRTDLPGERITATFTEDSRFKLTPELVGPCKVLLEGVVGEGVTLDLESLRDIRPRTVTYHLAKNLLYRHFRDPNEEPKLHLFDQLKRIARRWLDEGYFVPTGGTMLGQLLYQEMANQACQRIFLACQNSEDGDTRIKAILDAYNPKGSTRHVSFNTSKPVYKTHPGKSHINFVVQDSDWEAEFARVAEAHPRVICYVKNQGLQFDVPYLDGSTPRKYRPDFIVRVDDGGEEPINVVVEIKGYRRGDAQLKAETMRNMWVPGVNNIDGFGRWAFDEFTDVHQIDDDFAALVQRLCDANKVSA